MHYLEQRKSFLILTPILNELFSLREEDVIVSARGISANAASREEFFNNLADDYLFVDDVNETDYAKRYRIDLSVDASKWNFYINSENVDFCIRTGDENTGIKELTFHNSEFSESENSLYELIFSSNLTGVIVSGFQGPQEYRLSFPPAEKPRTIEGPELTEEPESSEEPEPTEEPNSEAERVLILFYNGNTIGESTCVYYMDTTELPEKELSFCFARTVDEKLIKLEGEALEDQLVTVTIGDKPEKGMKVKDPAFNTVEGDELKVFPGQKIHVFLDPEAQKEYELYLSDVILEEKILTINDDTTITVKAITPPPTPGPTPAPTEEPLPSTEPTVPPREPKGNSNTILILVIGLVVVGIIVGAVAAIAASSSKKSKVSADKIPQKDVGPVHVKQPAARVVDAAPYAATVSPKGEALGQTASVHKPKLIVTGGALKGKSFDLKPNHQTTVGRGGNCDIVFSREDRYVSQIHMTVTYDSRSNQFVVFDSSSNGTFTPDKRRLPNNMSVSLPVGSTLLLGDPDCSIVLK